MSTKQIILSAFVLSSIGIFGINATNAVKQSTSSKEIPSVICIYTFEQIDCYGPQKASVQVQFGNVDENSLKHIKKIGKDDDFIICPCDLGLHKKIKIYNPTNPFDNKKCAVCASFNEMISNASTEERKSFIDSLHSTK
jgi:hypothetical protein